jgi:hypothetical protein
MADLFHWTNLQLGLSEQSVLAKEKLPEHHIFIFTSVSQTHLTTEPFWVPKYQWNPQPFLVLCPT